MSEITTLAKICDALSDGLHKAPIFNPNGQYLFVNATNLENGHIVDKGEGKRADFSEFQKYGIELNDRTILYSIDGTIGNIARYRGEKVILGKGACYLKVKECVDPDFIYFLLQSEAFNGYIRKMSTGSTIHHISLETMRNFKFSLPDYDAQKRISSVLIALENKIHHNTRLITELESMVKTIYDYWFTQLDFPNKEGKPYHSSGGKMVWDNQLKREIPKGWDVGNLYAIADPINGLACQKHRPKENEKALPVVKIKEMHEGITEETELVSVNIPAKHKIFDGDILFSWSATLEVMYWFGGDAGLNQHIFKVVPINGFSKEYVYHQFSAYVINFVKMAEARKTTMGHITSDHLEQSRIVLPPSEIVQAFSEIVAPIHEKIGQCQKENRELIKLRNWLLPMLMNGQATVE